MNTKKPAEIACADVLRQLYAYLDGEVDNLTESDIEHHLHHCRECFSRVDFEKKLKNKITASASMPTPNDVKARLNDIMSKF